MPDDNTLVGHIESNMSLIGTISDADEMAGVFSISEHGFIGTLDYGAGSHIAEYLGPYFTVPTAESQTFETKSKKMMDNFTVDATPISDVRTVDTDGYTITVL